MAVIAPVARKGVMLQTVSDAFVFGLPWFMDVTVSESGGQGVEWTRNPLEDGTSVTDHGVLQPPELTLSGWVTETPMDVFDEQPDRLNAVLDALMEILAAKETVIVIHGSRVYVDYVLSEVRYSRGADEGMAATVEVSLTRIQRVTARVVMIPPQLLAPTVRPGGATEVDAGTQAGTQAGTAPEADAAADESLLHQALDGALSSFGVR